MHSQAHLTMAKLWRAPRPWTTRAVRPASSRTAIGVISALSLYSRDDPPFYVPASLQRAADVRLDERTLQAHRADPTARALLVTRGRSKSLVASQVRPLACLHCFLQGVAHTCALVTILALSHPL
jgi:hypothetical protein